MSRGFKLPIGWFFTPPDADSGIDISTPDKPSGSPAMLLIDAVLGTPETIQPWEEQLRIWPSFDHRVRIAPDGKSQDLGREMPDIDDRLSSLLKSRTAVRIGEVFGDTANARNVLASIIEVLDDLDTVADTAD